MEETLKNSENEIKGNLSQKGDNSEGGLNFLIYRLIAIADQNRSNAAMMGQKIGTVSNIMDRLSIIKPRRI